MKVISKRKKQKTYLNQKSAEDILDIAGMFKVKKLKSVLAARLMLEKNYKRF